jgi:hypothetical protein
MNKAILCILLGMILIAFSAKSQTFELGEESKSKEKTKNIYQLSDGSFFTSNYTDDEILKEKKLYILL